MIEKPEVTPYKKSQPSCLKHRSLRYKPHNSAACHSFTQEQVLAHFGNPDFSETAMAGSQHYQDKRKTLTLETGRAREEGGGGGGDREREGGREEGGGGGGRGREEGGGGDGRGGRREETGREREREEGGDREREKIEIIRREEGGG
ncbi:hypothetical protein ACLB2K_017222 [Fragaria x ananassa]